MRPAQSHDSRAGRRRRTQIGGQFSAHLIDMLRSPAWCVLSLSARRILDRIEIEHAGHGSTDNGKLPVTFDDFARYGVERHAIAPAIREVVALGFLEVTDVGRAGNAEWRKPSRYRLTYRHTNDAAATDDWKRIASKEDAAAIARMSRGTLPAKNKTPVGETPLNLSGETPLKGTNSSVGKPHYSLSGETPLPSISWEGSHRSTGRT